jgi:hypothetical protein
MIANDRSKMQAAEPKLEGEFLIVILMALATGMMGFLVYFFALA